MFFARQGAWHLGHLKDVVGHKARAERSADGRLQALAQAGVCVVSGLALGVDAAAHEGALLGQAPTLAVVGTGLDRVYPRRHADLARPNKRWNRGAM